MADHTTDIFQYSITEIDNFVLMNNEGLFMAVDKGYSDMVNNNVNDNESEGKEKDASYQEKLRVNKRGRPCAKPPTKEMLNRRRKVALNFPLLEALNF